MMFIGAGQPDVRYSARRRELRKRRETSTRLRTCGTAHVGTCGTAHVLVTTGSSNQTLAPLREGRSLRSHGSLRSPAAAEPLRSAPGFLALDQRARHLASGLLPNSICEDESPHARERNCGSVPCH